MTQGWMMLLGQAGLVVSGAVGSLALLALARRLQAWRAERMQAEWDPY